MELTLYIYSQLVKKKFTFMLKLSNASGQKYLLSSRDTDEVLFEHSYEFQNYYVINHSVSLTHFPKTLQC